MGMWGTHHSYAAVHIMGMRGACREYAGCTLWIYGVHAMGMWDASHGYAGYTPWLCGVHATGTLPESNSAKVICNKSEATERLDT